MKKRKTNPGVFLSSKTKRKVKAVLEVVAIIIAAAIIVELLRLFMWMCYAAGIPM